MAAIEDFLSDCERRMDKSIETTRHEFNSVRTGRASVTILDPIHVEAYGARMPLNQLASLSVPEPSLIIAQPFDPSQLAAIERAIRASDLGLNPANDGKVVRIPIPALTEERRKELSRHVHKLAEERLDPVEDLTHARANDRRRGAKANVSRLPPCRATNISISGSVTSSSVSARESPGRAAAPRRL